MFDKATSHDNLFTTILINLKDRPWLEKSPRPELRGPPATAITWCDWGQRSMVVSFSYLAVSCSCNLWWILSIFVEAFWEDVTYFGLRWHKNTTMATSIDQNTWCNKLMFRCVRYNLARAFHRSDRWMEAREQATAVLLLDRLELKHPITTVKFHHWS